jgi:hypothetical protein
MRNPQKFEIVASRVTKETADRMDRLLLGGEVRAAFIRKAVEVEIARREREAARATSRLGIPA